MIFAEFRKNIAKIFNSANLKAPRLGLSLYSLGNARVVLDYEELIHNLTSVKLSDFIISQQRGNNKKPAEKTAPYRGKELLII